MIIASSRIYVFSSRLEGIENRMTPAIDTVYLKRKSTWKVYMKRRIKK